MADLHEQREREAAMSVQSRRLRPIYIALDDGDDKGALKKCDQLLKKRADPMVSALRALAMTRLGRMEDATEQMEAIKNTVMANPSDFTDGEVLRTLLNVGKRVGNLDDVVAAYEAVADAAPADAGMQQNLFFMFVRLGRYREAQTAALSRIHSVSKDTQHMMWAIVAVSLQGGLEGNNMFLMLAERMVDKMIEAGTVTEYEQVLFLLLLLERQEKFERSLEVVAQFRHLFNVDADLYRVQADLNERLGHARTANAIYRHVITHVSSDWAYFAGYLDTLFKIIDGEGGESDGVLIDPASPEERTVAGGGAGEGPSSATGDGGEASSTAAPPPLTADGYSQTVDEARALFAEIAANDERPTRYARLAVLELEKRLVERVLAGDGTEAVDFGPLRAGAEDYFKTFSAKAICHFDLEAYVSALPPPDRVSLADALQAWVDAEREAADGVDANVKAITRACCLLTLRRCMGLLTPAGDAEVAAVADGQALTIYQAGLDLGVDIERGERLVSDDALLVAAQILEHQHSVSGNDQLLVEGAALLEYGVANSPFNFQIDLALADRYVALACATRVFDKVDDLEIKNIQLDTLTHPYVPAVVNFGIDEDAAGLCNRIRQFYNVADSETPEWIGRTFVDKSYSKTTEFIAFHEKLSNSAQRCVAQTGMVLLQAAFRLNSAADVRVYLMDVDLDRGEDYYATLVPTHDHEGKSNWEAPAARQETIAAAEAAAEANLTRAKAARELLACLGAALEGDSAGLDEARSAWLSQIGALGVDPSAVTDDSTPEEHSLGVYGALLEATALVRAFTDKSADNTLVEVDGDALVACAERVGDLLGSLSARLVGSVDYAVEAEDGSGCTINASAVPWINEFTSRILGFCLVLFEAWAEQLPKKKKKKKNDIRPAEAGRIRAALRVLKAAAVEVAGQWVEAIEAAQARVGYAFLAKPEYCLTALGASEALAASRAAVAEHLTSNHIEFLRRAADNVGTKHEALRAVRF